MVLRRVAYLTVTAVLGLSLTGCALGLFGGFERRAAWHDDEERACIVANAVRPSLYIQRARHLNDRGACGIDSPLKVSAMADGTVSIGPVATLNCPMTAAVEGWLSRSVQPAALAWFGQPVVEVRQLASYSCRPINSEPGNQLSEHAYGNAIDVGGFRLADGRVITVKTDWNGDPNAAGFLHEVFAGACGQFKTVLGPGVKYHGDHFHLDLAHHNKAGTSRYCRPMPDGAPPPRAPYSPGLIARTKAWLDFGKTGSIAPGGGEYLSEPPPDVEKSEFQDPFGAYRLSPGVDAR